MAAVVIHKVVDLPGAVDEEGGLPLGKELDGLSIGGSKRVHRKITFFIQVFDVVEGSGPFLSGGIAGGGGNLQLVIQGTVVHDAELKPVMGHLKQRAGDGSVTLGLNRLAVGEELLPGVVGTGDGHAAVGQDLGVDKHVLPEAGRRDGVVLAV